MATTLQDLQTKLETAKKEIREQGNSILLEMVQTFFEQIPMLLEIRVRQYTPGFNDGDPCVNTLEDPHVKMDWVACYDSGALVGFYKEQMEEGEDPDTLGDYEDGFAELYGRINLTGIEEWDNALVELRDMFESSANIIELLYDTNTELLFKRDGTATEEPYDCGY